MTVATETENNTTITEKEDKDMKDMKAALNEETPTDNKQQQDDDAKDAEKTEGDNKKEENTEETPVKSGSVHKTNYEKDIVYLYQFSRTPMIPSISPYSLKVETWLRLNDIKYEVRFSPFIYYFNHNFSLFSSFLSTIIWVIKFCN